MRTKEKHQKRMWSYVSDEERIPQDHPLRAMSEMVNAILREMSPHFARLYADDGRASVPPERLLRALLLQMFYSIRSERMLVEQLRYNILFRWFVGLEMDEEVWHPTTFTKNRERLLQGDTGREFFERVVALAREKRLMSDEHFTVDGTLIEAWAGQKSFRPKNGPPNDTPGKNPDVDFSQAPRRNETHASTTDPDARLYRKSLASEARLCYSAHVLMENRHGLVADIRLTTATGTAEREAALEMAALIATSGRVTLGGDKGYDVSSFTKALRELRITPHVASRIKYSSLDGRTTRHAGYQVSQRKRKRVEEIFGWMKTVAGIRKTRHRGRDRVGWMVTLTAAAFNLVRIRNLQATPA
jgi:transposase